MSLIILSIVFLFACIVTWYLASHRSIIVLKDVPNERSLHDIPIPRTGGIGVLTGLILGWVFCSTYYFFPNVLYQFSAALLLLVFISLIDDMKSISAGLRILVHFIAALVVVFNGLGFTPGILGSLVTLITIVWVINLYNFMDGMDGFAGGMSVFGFFFLGLAGYLDHHPVFPIYSWVVSAAALGFLIFNFPPAKIFLGDVGSISLGFFAAAFSLWGIKEDIFQAWFPFMVFSPFFVDATVTLFFRLVRREKVWRAHRTHFYQRLVQSGLGHTRTVLIEYALMLAVGFSALILLIYPDYLLTGLILWSLLYVLLAILANLYCGNRKSTSKFSI